MLYEKKVYIFIISHYSVKLKQIIIQRISCLVKTAVKINHILSRTIYYSFSEKSLINEKFVNLFTEVMKYFLQKF